MGLLLRESGRRERSSPVWSTGDQGHLSGERSCRTAGCERGLVPRQVATRLQKATDRSAANTVESMPEEMASASVRVQAARLRLGSRDCGQSSFSQLKLSENRRKHFSSPTTPHIACNVVVNAFQQYEWLARLATAKLERRRPILGLAHPPLRETTRIH